MQPPDRKSHDKYRFLWRRRPWYRKLREDLWGQVVNLLQWFSNLKRHHRGPGD